jgi:hypothetical protein
MKTKFNRTITKDIAETIDLLDKVGFDYDKVEDCFFSRDYEVKFHLPARKCNDLVTVIIRLLEFEREMARYMARAELKAEIRRWLKDE